MQQPLRYLALEAAAAALRGISPALGYHSTVKRVWREYRTIEQIREYPSVIVLEGQGSTLRPFTQFAYEHRLIMRVYGYVRGEEGAPRSLRLEELDEDIARCLLLPTGRAWWEDVPAIVGVAPVNERETDEGLLPGGLGAFGVDYEIQMQEDYGTGEG